jgi:imidazolonepropionase-like amidohydrolase
MTDGSVFSLTVKRRFPVAHGFLGGGPAMLGFSLALLVAAFAPSPQPAVIALFGGQVLDGTGGPPIADGVVLVEGNKIVAVGPRTRVSIPAGARRLDARGGTILPGLTDLHTHAAYFVPNPRDFEDDSLNALRASAVLRQALDSGITLVRDAGARHYVSIGLKQAIAKLLHRRPALRGVRPPG